MEPKHYALALWFFHSKTNLSWPSANGRSVRGAGHSRHDYFRVPMTPYPSTEAQPGGVIGVNQHSEISQWPALTRTRPGGTRHFQWCVGVLGQDPVNSPGTETNFVDIDRQVRPTDRSSLSLGFPWIQETQR